MVFPWFSYGLPLYNVSSPIFSEVPAAENIRNCSTLRAADALSAVHLGGDEKTARSVGRNEAGGLAKKNKDVINAGWWLIYG